MLALLPAFLGVSALVIVTPGPDTALAIRNTLWGGRRAGIFTALGVSAGQVTWALAASAGITALLRASGPAFVALRLLGAAYLAYLGVRALLEARGGLTRPEAREWGVGPALASRSALRQGLLSNLGNPKMAVFFTSLLPQFGGTSLLSLLGLGLIFSFLTLIWLTGYALAVARVGDFLRRSRVRRALEALTGTALLGLGIRVAAEPCYLRS